MIHNQNPNKEFWRAKRVLVTGHTGFKGGWLTIWLNRLGANVTAVSLPPSTTPSLFDLADVSALCESHFCNVNDAEKVKSLVKQAKPQIVFHMAAQALVRAGYEDPLETFATNVQGTANVLDALRQCQDVRCVVAITTDKVYQNLEHPFPYRETDRLGGHDPYSASKAACEMIINSYRDSFLAEQNVAVASARAGNVIGGGDWSSDRLIPDLVRAWGSGGQVSIRRPQAVRPWQHVLEPLAGYLRLAEKMWHHPNLASSYNFGPNTHEAATVKEVVDMAKTAFGDGADVYWGDGDEGPHEAGWLALEVAKARSVLGVKSRWTLEQSVIRTVKWYIDCENGSNARAACQNDIDAYESL